MTSEVTTWLESLDARLASPTGALDIRAFIGTDVELMGVLAGWRRPPTLNQHALDFASLTLSAGHAGAARQSVEAALAALGGRGDRGLVVVKGVHLLASMYPTGPMLLLNKFLRTGRLSALLVFPPAPAATLPEGAYLAEWRTAMLQSVPPFQPEPSRVRKGDV